MFNLIILDESGSMHMIYQVALNGVNETLQTIRDAQKQYPAQQHFVTLVTFNSEHYNEIYDQSPAQDTGYISMKQYLPAGCTPLYDTMGCALTALHNRAQRGDVVLVIIITDGYENSSTDYNATSIKQLVETLKKEDWVFTYIGANQDVHTVGKTLSIENCLAFEADAESTAAMFQKESRSRKTFFGKVNNLNNDSTTLSDLSQDYFA